MLIEKKLFPVITAYGPDDVSGGWRGRLDADTGRPWYARIHPGRSVVCGLSVEDRTGLDPPLTVRLRTTVGPDGKLLISQSGVASGTSVPHDLWVFYDPWGDASDSIRLYKPRIACL